MNNAPETSPTSWLRNLLPNKALDGHEGGINNNSARVFRCKKGDDHVFVDRLQAVLARGEAAACPCCSLQQASSTNSVSLFPLVASEWHPAKNGKHVPSPSQTVWTSRAAVWFRCSKDSRHEWRAVVANRCNGEPCPFCSGKVPPVYQSLAVRLGQDLVGSFWSSRNEKKPEEVLSCEDVDIHFKDPLTGTEWVTTPLDFCEVAESSTFDNPMEAIYARFVDRDKRSRGLRMLNDALDATQNGLFENLLGRAVSILIDEDESLIDKYETSTTKITVVVEEGDKLHSKLAAPAPSINAATKSLPVVSSSANDQLQTDSHLRTDTPVIPLATEKINQKAKQRRRSRMCTIF